MSTRPNIVLMITDQQRFDTIAGLGFPHAITPNLDRLVAEGTSFTNCFITAPSCAPARASLFTGYYPHTTGIFKNGDSWRRSWVELLSESGYHCVNVGKMHTSPFETPLGFNERYVVENKDRYLEGRYYFDEWDKALAANGLVKQQRELYRKREDYKECLGAFEWELPEHLHSDTFVGGMARWWLDAHPHTDPLFLQIGFPGPHPPYDPVPRYAEMYKDRDIPIRAVGESDLADQPAALQEMRQHNCEVDHDSVVHLTNPTDEQRRRQRAFYLANVTMIDEQVGLVLQTLEDRGYLDDCIVIFTSDHGDCLGDHGHSQKWTMYDTITRVPAIVWSPGRFAGGQSLDGLCQLMDFGPTILDLAGVDIPESMEARSLLPALEGAEYEWRKTVYAEHSRDATLQGTAMMTMVRDKRWKLVHFVDGEEAGPRVPAGQLFDLEDDPEEEHNLWHDPAAEAQKQRLLKQMGEWLIHSNLRTAGWKSDTR